MVIDRRAVVHLLLAGSLCAWSASAWATDAPHGSADTVRLTFSIPGMH